MVGKMKEEIINYINSLETVQEVKDFDNFLYDIKNNAIRKRIGLLNNFKLEEIINNLVPGYYKVDTSNEEESETTLFELNSDNIKHFSIVGDILSVFSLASYVYSDYESCYKENGNIYISIDSNFRTISHDDFYNIIKSNLGV
jgi:hypothetical protein